MHIQKTSLSLSKQKIIEIMEENKKPSNPIAFPSSSPDNIYWNEGMTLRDYFASKAMTEIPMVVSQRYLSDSDYDEWARKCYKRADAMLKQREL